VSCQNNKTKQKTTISKKKTVLKQIPNNNLKKSKIIYDNSNGEYLEQYSNGKIKIIGQKKDGKRTGVWTSFYENGTIWSETNYKNNFKEGESHVYYPSGNLYYIGSYQNNEKIGVWYFYNSDGSLSYKEKY
jgi:antitoxin component YwqK of YwqJK toxin-antitoxin module